MRSSTPRAATLLAVALLATTATSAAQTPPPRPPAPPQVTAAKVVPSAISSAKAGAAASAVTSAAPLTAVDPNAAMPPGHPSVGEADPHAGHNHPNDGRFEAPEDGMRDGADLPTGTIELHFEDPEQKPIGGFDMTLAIVESSIAKGESRSKQTRTVGPDGIVRFEGLSSKSEFSYRVSVMKAGANFAIPPFRMPEKGGLRGTLHIYPVSPNLEGEGVAIQTKADIFVEVKDDRVQFEETISLYNFGRTTWVPKDVVIALPEGFSALSAGEQMNDLGVDPVDGRGVRLKGTFGPGPHQVTFRYQTEYSGDSQVHAKIALPPHAVTGRVVTPSGGGLALNVRGFPTPKAITGDDGQKFLLTEKELTPQEDDDIDLTVTGLPGDSLAAKVIGALCLFFVAVATYAFRRRGNISLDKDALLTEKARILDDLVAIEEGHVSGEIGPVNYERLRREHLGTLARILALLEA